eukprot:TRINITY_DN9342_c0_g1_i1.p2 TRINITY_DN9342_c0_g1~~TRINITY_DN9342_c0_g1_i1.p2  ORF type:complete len:106 (-),score=13.08 TRINITY_DN9342_c0_g1_i1:296-613(-)
MGDRQAESTAAAVQQLRNLRDAFADSKRCVETLQTAKAGDPMLIPLTSSLYVPGRIKQLDTVMVDVGTGYFVEKETDQAVELLNRKIQQCQKFIDEHSKQQEQKK